MQKRPIVLRSLLIVATSYYIQHVTRVQKIKFSIHTRTRAQTHTYTHSFSQTHISWLDLHLNKNVPTTLLLMSRAFKITQNAGTEDHMAIKDTLQVLSANVLQRGAAYCIMLRCVAVCCSVLQYAAVCCSVLQRVAVCCSVLQCVAACRSVLQCVAV